MELSSPKVAPTEFCVLWNSDGIQCLEPTGSDMAKFSIDADLCPVHRLEMHEQRKENWLQFLGKELPENYYDD